MWSLLKTRNLFADVKGCSETEGNIRVEIFPEGIALLDFGIRQWTRQFRKQEVVGSIPLRQDLF